MFKRLFAAVDDLIGGIQSFSKMLFDVSNHVRQQTGLEPEPLPHRVVEEIPAKNGRRITAKADL